MRHVLRPARAARQLAAIALLAACAGCPGSLDDPGSFTEAGASDGAGAGCPNVPQDVLGVACAGSGCHNAQDHTEDLDLQSPGVAARLVGVAAIEGPGSLIDPSHPAVSVLYTKLTANPPFGARMPLTNGPLDDATITCVLAWITEQVADAGAGASGEAGGSDDAAKGD